MGTVMICILIGLVIGLITVMVMKAQLKSVHQRDNAQEYLSAGSLNLRVSTDRFLYENTTRVPKPKNDNKK